MKNIYFKVFERETNAVIKETENEKLALSYLNILDLEGNMIYDYQWFPKKEGF